MLVMGVRGITHILRIGGLKRQSNTTHGGKSAAGNGREAFLEPKTGNIIRRGNIMPARTEENLPLGKPQKSGTIPDTK
jgi:hypothetical protein